VVILNSSTKVFRNDAGTLARFFGGILATPNAHSDEPIWFHLVLSQVLFRGQAKSRAGDATPAGEARGAGADQAKGQ
jgi:hypothetical protein